MGRWAPFAWLVLIPVLTVPLTITFAAQILQSTQCAIAFGGSFAEPDRALCPDGPVLMSLLPGLLNLGPFVWLVLPGDDITRRNAIVAGTLGAVRLLVPVLGVLVTGPSPGHTVLVSGFFFVYPNSDYLPVVGISVLLWIVSVVTWIWLGIVEGSRLVPEAHVIHTFCVKRAYRSPSGTLIAQSARIRKRKGLRPSPEPLE